MYGFELFGRSAGPPNDCLTPRLPSGVLRKHFGATEVASTALAESPSQSGIALLELTGLLA